MRLSAILSPSTRRPQRAALVLPAAMLAAAAMAGAACARVLATADLPQARLTVTADSMMKSANGDVTRYVGSPTLRIERRGALPLVLRDGRPAAPGETESPPGAAASIVYVKPSTPEAQRLGASPGQAVVQIISR